MNRQYLKSLQERAQRLLQISSDQESSDQQNLISTRTKSRRVDLNEVLSNADINQLNTQLHDYRNTDVELLKRCIGLTNENTQLKRQIKAFDEQRAQLKAQNNYLEKELENYKVQLQKIRERQQGKNTGNESPFNKLHEINHFSFIQRNPAQSLKTKSQSVHRFGSTSRFNQSMSHQENTIMLKQVQKMEQRYKKQILQLDQRLKVSNQKRQAIQAMLQKQKEKTFKLWKFINQQIPQMRDIINNLTSKVDSHVESILLKDINQQEMKMKKRSHRHSSKYLY